MLLWRHKSRSVKILYFENYLSYRAGGELILNTRYIFLKIFKVSVLISHSLQSSSAKRYISHIPYLCQKTTHDAKHGGLIKSCMLFLLHMLHFTHYRIFTCTKQLLTELYNYTLVIPINISQSSILWQIKHFITFIIASTYFLSKLVSSRNETFIKIILLLLFVNVLFRNFVNSRLEVRYQQILWIADLKRLSINKRVRY